MTSKWKIKPSGQNNWYRLDNAAKIFPVITNQVRTMVFRLSVELNERIKLKELQLALSQTISDLPYFRSQLRKGFFWYWLEPSESTPNIQADNGPPCRMFRMSHRNHLLVRILAKQNKISAEFMHILCDATGGMQFLMVLLRNYGKLCNWKIDPLAYPISSDLASNDELYEDSYQKYFDKYLTKPARISRAYHLPLPVNRKPEFKVLTVQTDTTSAISLARKYEVSLTEYLAAVYLFVLQKFFLTDPPGSRRRKNKIIRIELPVNLRNLFPSQTLRNFALFVMPEIDPSLGEYSFKEITSIVHHYMQLETDKRQIKRIIRRNVGGERNPIVRGIPLLLKVPVLAMAYKNFGPPLYSGILTNFGKVSVPEDFTPYLKGFGCIAPPPDPKLKLCSALISYEDKLVLSFGNHSTSLKFEREVIRFLQNEGLNLKILNS